MKQIQPFLLFPTLSQRMAMLLVGIFAFLLYSNSILNDYTVDDQMVITENIYTQQGLKGLKGIFFDKETRHGFTAEKGARYYRPLSIASFAVEYQFFKKKPQPSHFFNVLYFSLSVVLLYRLLARYLFPNIPDVALIACILFALHPLHTEGVANLKGRDEIFSFLFLTLTFWYSFRYIETNRQAELLKTGFSFFLALLSKENGFTFLAILPLTLYCFTELNPKGIAKIMLPVGIALVLYFGIRVGITGFSIAPERTIILDNLYQDSTFEEKYATILYVLLFYLKLLVVPYPLSWDYTYDAIGFRKFTDIEVIASLVIQTIFVGWALWKVWQKNLYAYAILFYYLSVFIVSNILIDIGGYVGERFLYQASLGFCILVGLLCNDFLQLEKNNLSISAKRNAVFGLLLVCTVLGGGYTIARNAEWKDNTTLHLADVQKVPNSLKANAAAGSVLIGLANKAQTDAEKEAYLRQATTYLRKAIAIYPNYIYPNLDLSLCYVLLKNADSTEYYYQAAGKIDSTDAVYKMRRKECAKPFLERANAAIARKDYDAYVAASNRALFYDPNEAAVWFNLGLHYNNNPNKNPQEAIRCLKKATELDPMNPEYFYNLGVVYWYEKDLAGAKYAWEQTVKLNPQHSVAQQGLQAIAQQMPTK